RIRLLLDDMAETMRFSDGVGLAASQVGVLRRVAVADVGEGLVELVNPVIVNREGSDVDFEGCLSVPGFMGEMDRPFSVTVEAKDRDGNGFTLEAEGLLARVICHELDHLDGQTIRQGALRLLTKEEYEALGSDEGQDVGRE
ncbi:MAG: peptide deformylase, partial [Oscillospiraceae bacterium]|nr:peptide deformylase [Oscillospiraceae bacterium]